MNIIFYPRQFGWHSECEGKISLHPDTFKLIMHSFTLKINTKHQQRLGVHILSSSILSHHSGVGGGVGEAVLPHLSSKSEKGIEKLHRLG